MSIQNSGSNLRNIIILFSWTQTLFYIKTDREYYDYSCYDDTSLCIEGTSVCYFHTSFWCNSNFKWYDDSSLFYDTCRLSLFTVILYNTLIYSLAFPLSLSSLSLSFSLSFNYEILATSPLHQRLYSIEFLIFGTNTSNALVNASK